MLKAIIVQQHHSNKQSLLHIIHNKVLTQNFLMFDFNDVCYNDHGFNRLGDQSAK